MSNGFVLAATQTSTKTLDPTLNPTSTPSQQNACPQDDSCGGELAKGAGIGVAATAGLATILALVLYLMLVRRWGSKSRTAVDGKSSAGDQSLIGHPQLQEVAGQPIFELNGRIDTRL